MTYNFLPWQLPFQNTLVYQCLIQDLINSLGRKDWAREEVFTQDDTLVWSLVYKPVLLLLSFIADLTKAEEGQ